MRIFDIKDMKHHSGSDSSQNWIKSSYSMTNGNCIEVAGLSRELIGVRDSKDPAGPVIGFRPAQWDAFVGHVRNDAFRRR
jgi:Domain of unknown function (DUF397)